MSKKKKYVAPSLMVTRVSALIGPNAGSPNNGAEVQPDDSKTIEDLENGAGW